MFLSFQTKYGNHFYMTSRNLMLQLTEKYNAALDKCDVLVMPTIHCLPPKLPKADISITG